MSAAQIAFLFILFPFVYMGLIFTNYIYYLYDPMWRIGGITIISIIYFFYGINKRYTKRKNDYMENLSLISGHIQGIDYFFTKNYDQKKETTFVNTWIEGIYGYDFSLKFEGRFERFFKAWGFSAECQTGEKQFDEMVYIVSDDEWLCQELKKNNELRERLYSIFRFYHEKNFKIKNIQCFDGRLIVQSFKKYDKLPEYGDDPIVTNYSREIASLMNEVISYLPSNGSIDGKLYREKNNHISFGFFVLMIALVANGFSMLTLEIIGGVIFPKLVEPFSTIPLALTVTAVVITIIVIIGIIFLSKSSRFVPFITLLIFGTFGIFTTAVVEIKEFNVLMDKSLQNIYYTNIVSKYMSRGHRGPTRYYLSLENWRNQRETYKIKVGSTIYYQVQGGDSIAVFQKKGYLDYPWIKNIEILSKSKKK